MDLSTFAGEATAFAGGVLALGRFAGEGPSEAEKAIDAALGGALAATADRLLFKGKPRQKVAIDTGGRLAAARVVLLGLGERSKLGAAQVRDFAALAADEATAGRHADLGILPPTDDLVSVAQGLLLGTYRFTAFHTEDPEAPRHQVGRAWVKP